MNLKRKLMVFSLAGVAGIGLTVGGATYALFSSSTANEGNQFTAGTLKITAKRDDVPNVGPMFYTNTTSQPGTLPTGEWAPGDRNTRGLFLKNDGTLQAKLTTLTAKAADKNGNAVTSGNDFDAAAKFAQKAKVLIWQVQWVDPFGGVIPNMQLNGTQTDAIMTYVNDAYKAWVAQNPNGGTDPLANPDAISQLIIFTNQYLLEHINGIKAAGRTSVDGDVQVAKLYKMNLNDLLNKRANVSRFGITTNPGESQLLAFTVELAKDADNTYQGMTANFNFGTDWVQTRNN